MAKNSFDENCNEAERIGADPKRRELSRKGMELLRAEKEWRGLDMNRSGAESMRVK